MHTPTRTFLLIAVIVGLFIAAGHVIAGPRGALIALALAGVLNYYAYWNCDKIVLRLYDAHEISAQTAPDLYRIVQTLSQRAGLPMPRICVIDSDQPNAFATGRNPENAAVVASTGLLRLLDSRELAAVMAHELAHIANRDTLTMTITAILAGAIGYLAQLPFLANHRSDQTRSRGAFVHLIVIILAPLVALLVQMAISRTREYSADATGAQICGDPGSLATALQKIDQAAVQTDNPTAEENPATAHLFIINPLSHGGVDNLFSTHPSTANRIKRLTEFSTNNQKIITRNKGPWG